MQFILCQETTIEYYITDLQFFCSTEPRTLYKLARTLPLSCIAGHDQHLQGQDLKKAPAFPSEYSTMAYAR